MQTFLHLDHDLPDLPATLEGFGIAQAFDRFVYVCGGYDQSSPKSVTPPCSGCGKGSSINDITQFINNF